MSIFEREVHFICPTCENTSSVDKQIFLSYGKILPKCDCGEQMILRSKWRMQKADEVAKSLFNKTMVYLSEKNDECTAKVTMKLRNEGIETWDKEKLQYEYSIRESTYEKRIINEYLEALEE